MVDKEKKFGMEMMQSLHREVKAEAARRGLKLKEATKQAFTSWLGKTGESSEPGALGRDSAEAEALLFLLREGDEGWRITLGNAVEFGKAEIRRRRQHEKTSSEIEKASIIRRKAGTGRKTGTASTA